MPRPVDQKRQNNTRTAKLNGRSIRIYLVDGDASGLLTAEVMNWSGKFVVAPRTMLKELASREEVARTEVYILAGPDPENAAQDMIYVGEGDNVLKRITTHDKDSDKEFWTRCVAVISKGLNLTKSHVRFLESRLIAKGNEAGRARLCNGTAPPLPPMPEPDVADILGFLSHIELVLPVLGFDFLKPRPVVGLVGEVCRSSWPPVFLAWTLHSKSTAHPSSPNTAASGSPFCSTSSASSKTVLGTCC